MESKLKTAESMLMQSMQDEAIPDKINVMLRDGKLLKTYRKLIGIKQFEAAKMFNTKQGNYCKIEQGLANPGFRLIEMKRLFDEWKVGEIKRLKDQIKFLETT